MHITKEHALRQYFGYDSFRPQQAEIIDTVLSGKDSLVLMPTGGGKSLCFQIPAVLLPGLTVVISPLIALMKDQVEALRGNGIDAAYLNSSLAQSEQDVIRRQVVSGQLKMLYIAPEKLFSGNTFDWLREWNVCLFAVDESHCISSWGHDFRPEYRRLNILKTYFPKVPVIALTATADRVTRKDILKQLGIAHAKVFVASFDRPNLSLSVLPGQKRLPQIQAFLSKHRGQAGIIYCLSRKGTETVAAKLQQAGYRAEHYHAGLEPARRSRVQELFLRDDIQVIVATIAFGMGIDKSNVRWVIHYNLPTNVESFYQEIGRAGRDGSPSDTVLFYSYADIATRQEMIAKSEQAEEQKELLLAKLERMKQYAVSDICRRRVLISYFNEEVTRDCGNCDVCRNPRTSFDGTIYAQKALSAIARTGQKIAMGMLIDILRGSRNRHILQLGYDTLPTFGVGRDLRTDEWSEYVGQLLNSGIMDIAYDEAHCFKLNDVSHRVLRGGFAVPLVRFIPVAERKAREEELTQKAGKKEVIRDALFERLRMLRKQIADALAIPPYVVFSDFSLSEMAQKRPVSEAQMKAVSGIGEEKYRRYGTTFINEILAFSRETGGVVSQGGKDMTHLETLVLYKEGYSLLEMAEKRGFTPGTIALHLIRLKNDGHPVILKPLVGESAYQAIVSGMKELGMRKDDPMKPIFDLFGGEYNYGQIRIVLALLEE